MAALDMVAVPLRDGTELRLRAGINALCDFEAVLAREGFDPERELRRLELGAGSTVSAIRALAWACARDQHEGLTLRHVGTLLETHGTVLKEGVLAALALAAPEPQEEGKMPDPPGKPMPPAGQS